MCRLSFLIVSVICVSIFVVVYGDEYIADGRINQLACDHRSPDFEACQAKVYERECAKRSNEKFRRCRECEPTCAIPNPQVCILSCTPGCVCKDGFLRNKSDQCILADLC